MMTELSIIQRQLRELIAAPSGVAVALEELGPPAVRSLEATVRSDAKLPAVERLEVYANAYFYRIRDCLEDDFGALRAVLGEARFHNLVTAYLIDCPPRHPSLRFAGERLPDFVRKHPAAASFREDLRWLADLAHLEWAIVEAFDAADADILSRDELAAIDPARWVDLQFGFQPALTRLDLDAPAHRVRRAWDDDAPMETAISELESTEPAIYPLLVWRTAERVSYRGLDPVEAIGLDAAIAGETFGILCERIASEVGDGEAPNRAATLLARWQADGIIRGLARGAPD
jgi:hypothetical protein